MGKKRNMPADKVTLNLVIRERPAYYYQVVILCFIIVMAAIGAFGKFAVADRFSAVFALERQVQQVEKDYRRMAEENVVYPELLVEYEKYFTKLGNENSYADSMAALKLIENVMMPTASLQFASLSNKVLSVTLTGITLEQSSDIVRQLYNESIVGSVSMSSADNAATGAPSSVILSITMVTEGGEEQ